MKAFTAVLGRDLRTWGYIPLAGVVFAVVVLIAGFLIAGGTRFKDAAESSLAISLVVTVSMGLILGSRSLGRDLAGQDATFWLSRPLGAGPIFGGKLIASILLILGAAALSASPAYLFTKQSAEAGGRFALLTLALTLSALALAAAGDLMMRARTPLIAVVLVVLFAFAGGVWKLAEVQFQRYSFSLGFQVLFAGGVAMLATLLAGRAVAFARARYDARRQARLLTVVLALVLGIAFAAIFAWVWALGHLPLSAMDRVRVAEFEPGGGRVVVGGSAMNGLAQSAFVVDLERGSMQRVSANWWTSFDFAGGEVFSIEPSAGGAELVSVDRNGARTVLAELGRDAGDGTGLVASPDGSTFVVRSRDAVQVIDRSGAVLGAWKPLRTPAEPKKSVSRIALFESPASILLFEGSDGLWDIRRFDLPTRTIQTLGRFEGQLPRILPGLEQAIVHEGPRGNTRFRLVSVQTGETLLSFPAEAKNVTPLAGGGWGVLMGEGGVLAILDPAGRETRRIQLPHDLRGAVPAGELRPGALLFRKDWWEPRAPLSTREAMVVDLESGEIVARFAGVEPVFRLSWDRPLPRAGHPALGLVWDGRGLQRIDPQSLELRPVSSGRGGFGGRLPPRGDASAPSRCMSFEERTGRWIAHAALRIQIESIEPEQVDED